VKRSGPPARRTGLKRSGPLARGAELARGGRLPARSAKTAARDAVYPERRAAAFARDGGRCIIGAVEDCSGRAEQCHHLAGRVGPDPHRLDNLASCCGACHRWCHAEPAAAAAAGWMRSRLG